MYVLYSVYDTCGQMYETTIMAFGNRHEIYSVLKRMVTVDSEYQRNLGYFTKHSLRYVISKLDSDKYVELNEEMTLRIDKIPKKKYVVSDGCAEENNIFNTYDDLETATRDVERIIKIHEDNNTDSGLNHCVKIYELDYNGKQIKMLNAYYPDL